MRKFLFLFFCFSISFADNYKANIGELVNVTRRNSSLMDEFLKNYYYSFENQLLNELYSFDISFLRIDLITRGKWVSGIKLYENEKEKLAQTVNGFSGLLVDIFLGKNKGFSFYYLANVQKIFKGFNIVNAGDYGVSSTFYDEAIKFSDRLFNFIFYLDYHSLYFGYVNNYVQFPYLSQYNGIYSLQRIQVTTADGFFAGYNYKDFLNFQIKSINNNIETYKFDFDSFKILKYFTSITTPFSFINGLQFENYVYLWEKISEFNFSTYRFYFIPRWDITPFWYISSYNSIQFEPVIYLDRWDISSKVVFQFFDKPVPSFVRNKEPQIFVDLPVYLFLEGGLSFYKNLYSRVEDLKNGVWGFKFGFGFGSDRPALFGFSLLGFSLETSYEVNYYDILSQYEGYYKSGNLYIALGIRAFI
ncbi:MAG: hypothetical protein N2258_00710 [Brevinematales bacterium]|nr:hypothetical protein [Brevinematales bacterium]